MHIPNSFFQFRFSESQNFFSQFQVFPKIKYSIYPYSEVEKTCCTEALFFSWFTNILSLKKTEEIINKMNTLRRVLALGESLVLFRAFLAFTFKLQQQSLFQ
jgi:hypothetical protein